MNLGWTTPIAEFVTEDVTYTMMQMVPPRSTNVTKVNVAFVCTNDANHEESVSWPLAGYKIYDQDTCDIWYDEASGNYLATMHLWTDTEHLQEAVDFLSNRYSSKPKISHTFVSISHTTVNLTFDMTKKSWYGNGETVLLTAKCPDAPTITELTHTDIIQATKIRMENVDKVNDKTQSLASKYLQAGSYTVSPVTGSREEGGWTFTVTVTDYSPYVLMMAEKYDLNYRVDESTGTLVYTFTHPYNTSTGKTAVLEDGSGWKWDTTGLSNSIAWNGFTVYVKQIINVCYTDGVEDEEVFADQVYTIDVDGEIPAFEGTPTREGYNFVIWMSSTDEAGNIYYTATWSKTWTVTYTDGVEDEEVFADVVHTVIDGSKTPAFEGTPTREGYIFTGWTPEVAERVYENVTYTATWEVPSYYTITYEGVPEGVSNPNPTAYAPSQLPITLQPIETDGFTGWTPSTIEEGTVGNLVVTANIVAKPGMPSIGTNVSSGLLLFQCTRCGEEHSWLDSTAINANSNRTYWNASAKRWETYITAKVSNINTTQTRKNHFGNYQHYYADDAQKVQYYLYWNPDQAGSTATGNPTTGFWYAVDGNPIVIDVWCYGEPMPLTTENMPTFSYGLWVRDCTNKSQYNKLTKLAGDVVGVSAMTKDDAGNYWVTVTVSGAGAVQAFQDKYGAEYLPCDGEGDDGHISAASGHGGYAGTYQFIFKYAAFSSTATIDYSKNNWKFDADATLALGSGFQNYNGYPIWVCRHFTVTYTDGVEDEEVFADVVYTVRENAATPAFGDITPTREGYTFTGWDVEVASNVAANVVYTAQWAQN